MTLAPLGTAKATLGTPKGKTNTENINERAPKVHLGVSGILRRQLRLSGAPVNRCIPQNANGRHQKPAGHRQAFKGLRRVTDSFSCFPVGGWVHEPETSPEASLGVLRGPREAYVPYQEKTTPTRFVVSNTTAHPVTGTVTPVTLSAYPKEWGSTFYRISL
jgi:hypothetical protein